MSKKVPELPIESKMMLSVEEAAALLNVGRDRMFRLLLDINKVTKRPAVHSVKVGHKRLIPRPALLKFIDDVMAA